MRALTAAFLALLAFGHDDNHPNFDVLDFVDPLIGTANGGRYHLTMIEKGASTHRIPGHSFAGATLPFGTLPALCPNTRLTETGMAKAVADTMGENQAGFATDTTNVTGFSHMHDSGTGGVSHGTQQPAHPDITYYLRRLHWETSPSSCSLNAQTTASAAANGPRRNGQPTGSPGPSRHDRDTLALA